MCQVQKSFENRSIFDEYVDTTGQLFAAYFYGPPCTRHFYARQHIMIQLVFAIARPSVRPSVSVRRVDHRKMVEVRILEIFTVR